MKVVYLMYTSNNYYIILEFCNSGSLSSKIKEVGDNNFIPERTCLAYLFQIVAGITEMHSNKIIHRDIKPDNILFHGDTVKIADFGMAKHTDLANASTKVGTPLYQAPEIMNTDHGTTYTSAVDIWSIGVTFYTLVYKTHPWTTSDGSQYLTMAGIKEAVMTQSGINLQFPHYPQVSPQTKDLMRRMIEPNPKKRIRIFEIIMHPAFEFLNADIFDPADGSLILQEKAKHVLLEMKGISGHVFDNLSFESSIVSPNSKSNNDSRISILSELESSLRIPGIDPIAEFTNKMNHEQFYIRLILTFATSLSEFMKRNISTDTFWVGIMWSSMLLVKKAETYSLNLYTIMKNRTNYFNIPSFDKKVKNSNIYDQELKTFEYVAKNAEQVLKYFLEQASMFKNELRNLNKNREEISRLHDEKISFCSSKQTPEAVQENLTKTITMVLQVYFKYRRTNSMMTELATMKKIVLLDTFALNEIETQVKYGSESFSRELFYASIEEKYQVEQRINEMAEIRFKNFVK
jgi:serine/threonine protein kinase